MEGEMMKNIIKRLEAIKTGELIFGGSIFDDELADIIERLSKQNDTQYIVNLQCIISGHETTIAKLNNKIKVMKQNKDTGTLDDPLALAILFHHTYERLALGHDYITREGTRIFNPESKNGKLMVATCTEIIKMIKEEN
jgi:hypothetical protein